MIFRNNAQLQSMPAWHYAIQRPLFTFKHTHQFAVDVRMHVLAALALGKVNFSGTLSPANTCCGAGEGFLRWRLRRVRLCRRNSIGCRVGSPFRCSGLMQSVDAGRQRGEQAGNAKDRQTEKTLCPDSPQCTATNWSLDGLSFVSRLSCGLVDRKLSAPNASMTRKSATFNTSTLP